LACDADFSGMLQLQRYHALRLAMYNLTPRLGSFISPFQPKVEADPASYGVFSGEGGEEGWDDGHSPKMQSHYCHIHLL